MRIMICADDGEVFADLKVHPDWLASHQLAGHHESGPVQDAIEDAIDVETDD